MSAPVPRIRYASPGRVTSSGTIPEWTFEGLLASEGHFRLPSGGWSGGGPLYVHKASVSNGDSYSATYGKNGIFVNCTLAGVGGVAAESPPIVSQSFINKALDDAGAYALKGYNKTKPGRAEADLFVSLKELASDGLPSIPLAGVFTRSKRGVLGPVAVPIREVPERLRTHIGDLSKLGGEYLNVIFGWKPLINDLRKLYKAMKNVDTTINKLASQNGQFVRRRTVLVNDADVVQNVNATYGFAYANVYGAPPNWFTSGSSTYSVKTFTQKQVWYSAKYRYWIPNLPAWKKSWGTRAKLFGAYPTPGALYSAMPWSWLADWFANIGDIADALSPTAVDGLTMKYGYTMLHDLTKIEGTCATTHESDRSMKTYPWGTVGNSWDGVDRTFRTTYQRERKIRTGGVQPFGPDVKLADITPSRWAILGALGLSRSSLKL